MIRGNGNRQCSFVLTLVGLMLQVVAAPAQDLVWARRGGGPIWDSIAALAADDSGNIYIGGDFQGTVDFDPGDGIFNMSAASASDRDAFVSKLDKAGNLVWARRFGGTGFYDEVSSLALDDNGNVYTAGPFQLKADFDPGDGVFYLTSSSGQDLFVSKLDNDGDFLWARQLRGHFSTSVELAVDHVGNVYAAGSFYGVADFDPGPEQFNLTSIRESDGFMLKLDSNGDFVWAGQTGASSYDDVVVDSSGNTYTTGYFWGVIDVDPGPGVLQVDQGSSSAFFVSKVDPNGSLVWVKIIRGGFVGVRSHGLALDGEGNLYMTGAFDDVVDFDPGPGVVTLRAFRTDHSCPN